MMSDPTVRRYDPVADGDEVYQLWEAALGEKWSIPRPLLSPAASQGRTDFVAISEGRVIGFIATLAPGFVLAILVAEPYRRKGVGGALLEAAVASFRAAGQTKAVIGGVSSLWKGVPTELASAIQFFRRWGATPTERTVDQYRSLADFSYPEMIERKLGERGIRLSLAEPADADAILRFEDEHFPRWSEYFRNAVGHGQFGSIACVKHGQEIVGTALVSGLGSRYPGIQWRQLQRQGFGGIGTLGVSNEYRNQGLGYALSAFATKCVKDTGAGLCFINQSEAVPLYRNLGFATWAEYEAYEKEL